MTPDELQQQEELGRKIAAALAPLGFGRVPVVNMVMFSGEEFIVVNARAAGVAAYFEERGK